MIIVYRFAQLQGVCDNFLGVCNVVCILVWLTPIMDQYGRMQGCDRMIIHTGYSRFKDRQQLIRPILVRVQYIDNWYLPTSGPYIWYILFRSSF